MNNKVARNINLSTIEPKNILNKQEEQRQNHGYRECFVGCQMGTGYGQMGEDVRGVRNTNRQLQNSHGNVKCSIGNGVAKEPTCMSHGHEQ